MKKEKETKRITEENPVLLKTLEDMEKAKARKKKLILWTVGGALILAAVIAFIYAGIPALNLKKASLSYESRTAVPAVTGEAMDKSKGDVSVAEYDGTELLFNASNLTFKVVNKKKKTEWRSYIKNAAPGEDTALLIINYLGKDNVVYSWNSDTYCAALGTYEVYPVENGVCVQMDINEGESNRFYEYLPKKMSIERYEEFFVKGLEAALADGRLKQEEFDRYMMTLSLVYKRSVLEECYAVTYVGSPPTSATKQLIAVASLLGYDKEKLEEDAEEFSFAITKTEVAEFYVNMYITLEEGELKVSVPMDETRSLNDYYKIQNIRLLPNFGAQNAKQAEAGYFFVPDGAGALMKFNSFKSGVPGYERAVYNNDYFNDYYFMPEYGEELMMPVFGEIIGELGSEEESFLAIIEEGAESAFVTTALASTADEGAVINRICPTFDVVQFKRVKVYGPYSENGANYLVSVGSKGLTVSVRYLFFNKGESYYEMARAYRDYLVKNEGLSLTYRTEPSLYLDIIGSLDVTAHFLGIPYKRTVSVTEYSEAAKIVSDLSSYNPKVSYEGAVNGGLNNRVNTGASNVGKNGSVKERNALDNLTDVAYGVNLSRVYHKSIGYRSGIDSLKDYSNIVASISGYNVQSGLLQGYVSKNSSYYEMVSPYYLEAVADKFIKKAGDLETLYIKDLGKLAYADYDNSDMVDIHTGAQVADRVLDKLSKDHTLVLDDPFMKNVKYASFVTSIGRESSNYATFAYTVPFRQLVLNGICDFSTKNVNMSSRDGDYYVLQAAELGAIPQFTLTYKEEDVLKNSDYTDLYAVNYDNQRALIDDVYAKCADVLSKIGTTEIAGHRIVADGVFETEYANGHRVTVNYNLYSVTLSDGTELAPEGYVIR